jgi:hypothetical protein
MSCPVNNGRKKMKHSTISANMPPTIDCETTGFNALSSNNLAQYTIARIKNGSIMIA